MHPRKKAPDLRAKYSSRAWYTDVQLLYRTEGRQSIDVPAAGLVNAAPDT